MTILPAFNNDDVLIERKVTSYRGYFRVDTYQVRYRHFDNSMSKSISREVFERGHAAAALPYDPVNNTVVLIEQFRIGAFSGLNAGVGSGSPWLLELVAGIIDLNDDSPASVVRRETQEEANLQVLDIAPIYDFWVSPGGCSEHLSLFCVRVNTTNAGGVFGLSEEGENIRVHVLPIEQAFALLDQSKLNNAPSIIAIQWLRQHVGKLRQQWLANSDCHPASRGQATG